MKSAAGVATLTTATPAEHDAIRNSAARVNPGRSLFQIAKPTAMLRMKPRTGTTHPSTKYSSRQFVSSSAARAATNTPENAASNASSCSPSSTPPTPKMTRMPSQISNARGIEGSPGGGGGGSSVEKSPDASSPASAGGSV